MEREHPGMREGELSTMKVKSGWSPSASPRPWPHRHCQAGLVLGHRSLGVLHMGEVLNAGNVGTSGGGSLSVTDR